MLYQFVWPEDSSIDIPWWVVLLLMTPGLLAAMVVIVRAWIVRADGSDYDRLLYRLPLWLISIISVVLAAVISVVCVITTMVLLVMLGVTSLVLLMLLSLTVGFGAYTWTIWTWLDN